MRNYEMYQNTTTGQLADNFANLINELLCQPVDDFYSQYYNISTACTDGLDLWGEVLNFPRHIKCGEEDSYYTLSDDEYRVVLLIIYNTMTIQPTVTNLNSIMNEIFNEFGWDVYVQDYQDMSYLCYVFTVDLPDWIYYVFYFYDVLPRPQGVGVEILESPVEFLGFEEQVAGDTSEYTTGNLRVSIFYEDLENVSEAKLSLFNSTLVDIETATAEELQADVVTYIDNDSKVTRINRRGDA